ncbi:RNA polymerase sigma factor [Croceitalea rosinachiae]|uniref:Sigma-70 family RNA polymerase sigma factor n=1 Tax=Croceitalea rosinachiae TaxID=3075596 RepID=A0ABU3AEH3_9FLAO|nr:sigma-70 family RNA polymerase sigma factor [Croceitalea sp. F388]MDT0608584.1 sigma-70 family RNA polymerase sigma factor [Croceitalea sp. F388]
MGNPNKTLDALLVISYQTGDKKALALLFKRWNKKICVQAYRYNNDWESAKDVTQETWRTVITKIHSLRDANRFGSWVMTIASRKALDDIKREKKVFREFNEEYWVDKTIGLNTVDTRDQQIRLALNAITELPVDQRIVLKLFYLEEYSLKEISAITNVSISTVKTRLFRAREKMKLILKK